MKTLFPTPGPWTAEVKSGTIRGVYETHPVCPGYSLVASVGFPNGKDYSDRQIANAHLISAAPELFAMLSRVLDGLQRLPEIPDTISRLDMEQAQAALSKAKGTN